MVRPVRLSRQQKSRNGVAMKNTLKLIVPLVLGLLAAAFNYLALKSSVQEISFIKAKRDLAQGEIFEEGSVERLGVLAQHAETLKDSAILYQDLGLLSGQVATRSIKAGDIIFYRDTEGLQGEIYDFRQGDDAALPVSLEGVTTPPKMRVGDYVELKIPTGSSPGRMESKWIGPFRLTSVGEEISNSMEMSESSRISVAYDPKNRAMLDELEDFIDRSRSDEKAQLISIKLKR
jgi:hypothetical protein